MVCCGLTCKKIEKVPLIRNLNSRLVCSEVIFLHLTGSRLSTDEENRRETNVRSMSVFRSSNAFFVSACPSDIFDHARIFDIFSWNEGSQELAVKKRT